MFDDLAPKYDKEIGKDEMMMGLKLMRWWMCRKAKGEVLETAGGTARNVSYYRDGAVSDVTIIDVAPNMVEAARKKVEQHLEKNGGDKSPRFHFEVMDSQDMQFPDNKFDAVVDSFGLCSFEDPVAALKEMRRVCRSDGKVILIEHGLGTYDFICNILNKQADKHAERWGCWWNRDIDKLVREAGMEVVWESRWHFGTTYLMVCKPNKSTGELVE